MASSNNSRGEKSPQSDSDRKARQRAREKDALDWYAQERPFMSRREKWLGKHGMLNAIKEAYARAMGFDGWSEFCKSDDPERWKK
jgi:hypothetical protein